MKQTLIVILFSAILFSCKNKKTDDTQVLSATKDSIEYKQFLDWKEKQDKEAKAQEAAAAAPKTTTIVKQTTVTSPAPATTTTTTTRKKGWSKAAKGTAIGAGSGAVIGAVVNKRNRVAGAVIGGVIGAAGGYILGRKKDKASGRVTTDTSKTGN